MNFHFWEHLLFSLNWFALLTFTCRFLSFSATVKTPVKAQYPLFPSLLPIKRHGQLKLYINTTLLCLYIFVQYKGIMKKPLQAWFLTIQKVYRYNRRFWLADCGIVVNRLSVRNVSDWKKRTCWNFWINVYSFFYPSIYPFYWITFSNTDSHNNEQYTACLKRVQTGW